MPDPTPIHWNGRGVANFWVHKPWGPLVMPLLMLGTWALLAAMRFASPKGFRLENFASTFSILSSAVIALQFAFHALNCMVTLGIMTIPGHLIPIFLSVFLIILGNYAGKLRKNFVLGIRTPWTLASDEVWLRTHRFGGKVFVVWGIAGLVGALLGKGLQVLLAIWPVAVPAPILYSFFLYRRLEGLSSSEEPHDDSPTARRLTDCS
jgi:uncharacterized membrane protein